MRKLATIRKIDEIKSIAGADRIELALFGGWQSVVTKGAHKPGELVIYCEIDSWIPHNLAPHLSKGKEPRTYEDVLGERLRTIRLQGVLSQGLVLPLIKKMGGIILPEPSYRCVTEGEDVTEYLGIKKWEREIPACLAGQVKGDFPSWIRKTDQERAQNLGSEIADNYLRGCEFECTIKLDGSSFTGYHYNGELGVCSRNLELKINEENAGNTLVRLFEETGLDVALKTLGRNIAVQAELLSPGIQGNRENLKTAALYVFDIFDIDNRTHI